MTHCNAGTLATAKYGTALAPMYIALEHGWDPKNDLHVYCDETRPLLQGARLSAYEMQAAGIDTYVQCDNMASYTMKEARSVLSLQVATVQRQMEILRIRLVQAELLLLPNIMVFHSMYVLRHPLLT